MIIYGKHTDITFTKDGKISGNCKRTKHAKYFIKCDNCDKEFFESEHVYDKRIELINKSVCGKCARSDMARLATLKGLYDDNGNLKPNSGRFSRERVDAMTDEEYKHFCSQRKNASLIFHTKLNSDPILKQQHYEKVYKNSKIGYISKGQQEIFHILKHEDFELESQYSSLQLDIVDYKHKFIIEFNGDLWHANPRIYQPDEYISVIKMTAKEKWQKDYERRRYLESQGFKVVVVWESTWLTTPEKVFEKIFENAIFLYDNKIEIDKRLKHYIFEKFKNRTIKMHNKVLNKNSYVPYFEKDAYISQGYEIGFIQRN